MLEKVLRTWRPNLSFAETDSTGLAQLLKSETLSPYLTTGRLLNLKKGRKMSKTEASQGGSTMKANPSPVLKISTVTACSNTLTIIIPRGDGNPFCISLLTVTMPTYKYTTRKRTVKWTTLTLAPILGTSMWEVSICKQEYRWSVKETSLQARRHAYNSFLHWFSVKGGSLTGQQGIGPKTSSATH
jgi:hypothetical protein